MEIKCVKVFKDGPSKMFGRQPLKKFEDRPYHLNYFKGCLPQILVTPCLNTLTQMTVPFFKE